MADRLRVTVGDGKYTVVMDEDGKLHALRHGEPWRDCVGDGLILALAQEVRTLRDSQAKLCGSVADGFAKAIKEASGG